MAFKCVYFRITYNRCLLYNTLVPVAQFEHGTSSHGTWRCSDQWRCLICSWILMRCDNDSCRPIRTCGVLTMTNLWSHLPRRRCRCVTPVRPSRALAKSFRNSGWASIDTVNRTSAGSLVFRPHSHSSTRSSCVCPAAHLCCLSDTVIILNRALLVQITYSNFPQGV